MCTRKSFRCSPEDFQIERLRNVPGPTNLQWMKNRVVPNAVAVDFANGGVLSMKFCRCQLASNHANFGRKMSIHGRYPVREAHFLPGHLDMRHLSEGMNSGIRSSSPVQFNRGRHDLRESPLQVILNSVLIRLTLPTAKWSAVIGDGQLQAFEWRAHCSESR